MQSKERRHEKIVTLSLDLRIIEELVEMVMSSITKLRGNIYSFF